jgi:hypothetical protein
LPYCASLRVIAVKKISLIVNDKLPLPFKALLRHLVEKMQIERLLNLLLIVRRKISTHQRYSRAALLSQKIKFLA